MDPGHTGAVPPATVMIMLAAGGHVDDAYKSHRTRCTVGAVEVAISQLRANLRTWVEQARAGTDVVVTERGVPVARLVAIDEAGLIERLEGEGAITRPGGPRPVASGRPRVRAEGLVSDLVAEQRR